MQFGTRAAGALGATAALLAAGAPASAGPPRHHLQPPPGVAAPAPPPPPAYGIVVDRITGSGCAPDTAAVTLSADNTALTVTYGDYSVELAAGQRKARKDCRVTVRVRSPRGSQYAVTAVQQRGFADIGAHVRGTFAADYRYARGRSVYEAEKRFAAGTSGVWQDNAADLRWSRCAEDRPLHIDSSITLRGRGSDESTSFLAVDSTDADAAGTTLRLNWRNCRFW
ncbi:hypothetical protein GCM10010124_10950 [Pilimelia terevasa]|uniref:DUF4360 domain-containing protein n=1 Tax=Pilimelia terevasa TaxID=53372 RepID=A0A8J3BGG0_9ACTN|nr:DUF4360 domain-containing protein [Pilimelia terevasa]GGK20158.1 hypothetical protein GCM10010124_10950 [Pilimelia terevasa]